MQDFARQIHHPCSRQRAAKGIEGWTGDGAFLVSGFSKLRQIFDAFFKVSFFHINRWDEDGPAVQTTGATGIGRVEILGLLLASGDPWIYSDQGCRLLAQISHRQLVGQRRLALCVQ